MLPAAPLAIPVLAQHLAGCVEEPATQRKRLATPHPFRRKCLLFTRVASQTKAPFVSVPCCVTPQKTLAVAFETPVLNTQPWKACTPLSSSSKSLRPIVVFDLDGTLIDTAADLVASLNHTIAAADLAPVEADDLNHLVGHGAKVMIERAFSLRGRSISEEEFQPLLERFIDHYKSQMPGQSQSYPGLDGALTRLENAGYLLAVCTNKMEGLARPLLDGLDLTRRFAAITGGDTFEVRKPDAGHLLGTIEKAGGDPKRAVMVGDSRNDILVAQNARIASIAVPFGYSDVPVADLKPDVVIDHFDALTAELIERLLK